MHGYGKTKQPSALTFGGCPVISVFHAALSRADEDAAVFGCKEIFRCGISDGLLQANNSIRSLCRKFNYSTNLFYAADHPRFPHDSEDNGPQWMKKLSDIGIGVGSSEPNTYHTEPSVTFFNTFLVRFAKSLHNRIVYLTNQGYDELMTMADDYQGIYNPECTDSQLKDMIAEASQAIPQGNMMVVYRNESFLFSRDVYTPGVSFMKCFNDGKYIKGSYHPMTEGIKDPKQIGAIAMGTIIAKIVARANTLGTRVPHGALIERLGFKRVINTSHQELIVY